MPTKRSNEKLLSQFGRLAEFAVIKHIQSLHLSYEEKQDLLQALLAEMFRAPERYRNRRGMSVIIGSRLKDFRRGYTNGNIQPKEEITAGLIDSDDGKFPDALYESDLRFQDRIKILQNLRTLSSSERTVLGMTFGIDGHKEFSDIGISIRLRRPRSWIVMKRKQAIFKLQAVLGIRRTDAGLEA